MTDNERELLEANGAFYSAFARRDLRAMEELWSHGAPVACIHPGWEPLRGRDEVLESLRAIFEGGGAPATITCASPTPHLLGPYAAYVVCTERVPGGDLAATNLFVREDGKYRLVHHHAAPIARQQAGGPKTKPSAMN
jgi:hypothetical protein